MTLDDIIAESNVYHHRPPDGLSMAERVLWWTLRSVYEDYRRGAIDIDTAKKQKDAALRVYKSDAGQLDRYHAIMKEQADYWQSIELAARTYALSDERTAAADEFYKAVYGCELKERRKANEP